MPNSPQRTIIDNNRKRTLYQFRGGYWFIALTPKELEQYPGNHWSGYVLVHKWKWWKKYGEWYGREEGVYHYLDGDRNNIRITNIGVKATYTQTWL